MAADARRRLACLLGLLALIPSGCTIERKVSKSTYSHTPHGFQRKAVGGESFSPGRKVEQRRDPVFRDD